MPATTETSSASISGLVSATCSRPSKLARACTSGRSAAGAAKTTLAALVGLWDCLLRPDLDALVRPGERRHAVAVATNLRQARLFVRAALSIVERSPLLAEMIETVTEDEIHFANGSALSAFPCTSRGARGWPISTLLMDEAAHFISDTDGPAVAERIFASLAPSTAQFGDLARIIVASTPYGGDGFFAETYQRAASGELPDAKAEHATTADVNPTVERAFLVREQARDPDSFASEYEARFVGGGLAYFDPERLQDAVADRGELLPEQATAWVAGVDVSFTTDPLGLALVGRDPLDPRRLVLGLARAWKPSRRKPRSFEERRAVEDRVLAEVAEVCLRYRARIVGDQYLAAAVADYFRRKGLGVTTTPLTASSKTQAFAETRARLYGGTLELYPEPGLLTELRSVRTRYSAGSASVVTPRTGGSHCDMAVAVALAVAEHDKYGLGAAGSPPSVGDAPVGAHDAFQGAADWPMTADSPL